MNEKRKLLMGGGLIGAFVLWTVLIQWVDVQAVGLNGTLFLLYGRNDFEKMTSHRYEYVKGLNGHSEIALYVDTFDEVDELDITDKRLHHEIYLSDARKVAPEKLKTVIRHPIKAKGE